MLITAAIFTMAGAAGIWVGLESTTHAVGLIWGVIALPIAIYLLNAQAGTTTLSPGGIRAWRPLRWHACPWSEVTDITCRAVQGRGSDVSYVLIHRANGRAFKCPLRSPRRQADIEPSMSSWR